MPEEAKASIFGKLLRDRDTWTWVSGLLVVLLALANIGKPLADAYAGLLNADRMTSFAARISGAEARSLPVTLISIDDDTRVKWGDPIITDHAALAELIRIAREKGATSILLDIDLSSETPAQTANGLLGKEIEGVAKDGPLLMLVRSIRFRGAPDNFGRRQYRAESTRPTPYDGMVAGKVVWVNAVTMFEGDRVARKIQLWQSVCNIGSGGTAYAAPALYVAAVASGEERLGEVAKFLEGRAIAECDGRQVPAHEWPARQTPPVAVQFIIGPNTPDTSLNSAMFRGERVPVFRNVPAWTLLDVSASGIRRMGEIDLSPFKGRSVVIGVTHADSRDINATPLGSQPGVLILTNSIIAAQMLADTPELPMWAEGAIIAILFIVFAGIGIRLHLIVATLLIAALSVAAIVMLSRLFGFDAAIRILAVAVTLVALHRIADTLAGIVFDWKRGLGWRALLKPKPGFRKP